MKDVRANPSKKDINKMIFIGGFEYYIKLFGELNVKVLS